MQLALQIHCAFLFNFCAILPLKIRLTFRRIFIGAVFISFFRSSGFVRAVCPAALTFERGLFYVSKDKGKIPSISTSHDWMCLFYPESFDFDIWVKNMRFNSLTGLVSPLHSPDPECKKDHYHAVFHFGGRKVTASAALYILGDLPANGHLEKPTDVYYGCERYWTHYDHLDRQQWYQFDEPYEPGRFCTVLGDYQFHQDSIEKTDKLVLIFDCYYNEFRVSAYKREKQLEFNAFMRFLREKHVDLLSTAIRNTYNLKTALNIF